MSRLNRKQSCLIDHRSHRGFSLVIALIALVAMSLTAMALIRSVDTGNLIAGNVAFRQGASQAIDVGAEAAYTYLTNTLSAADLDSNGPGTCGTRCRYYATQQLVDPNTDIPSAIDWANVPSVDTTGMSINGIYTIRYVIERLCSASPTAITLSNQADYCYLSKMDEKCINNNPSNPSICSATQGIHYRTTIYVTGPRNTKSYAQAIFVRY